MQENMQDNMEKHNAALAAISRDIFGDAAQLKAVSPTKLTLLKDNARYFKRETFRQLRDNIASDKMLSSVPLCYQHEDGSLEVLSGNHRVKASMEAGLEHIMVLVITEPMEASKRIAVQLSHNALVGEDDQSILANLWAQIESVQDKLYSGLDSETLQEFGDVELINFSTPQVPARMVTFMFTDGEHEHLAAILDMLAESAGKSSAVYMGSCAQYDKLMSIIADTKNAEKVRDSSLAIMRLLEIAEEWLEARKQDEMQGAAS